jgi:hypothetical protein
VNLSTGRVLVIVALVVVGLAILANGFSDSGTSAATLTPTPSAGGGGHTTSSTTPPPTSAPPSPTPAPQTKGVLFMAMNGTDVPGAGAAAQQKLTDAGYTPATDAIDAPTSGIKKTIVYYRDDDNAPQNQSNANYVAQHYFKHATVKPLDPSLQGVPKSATIVVVVGEDYAQQLVGG